MKDLLLVVRGQIKFWLEELRWYIQSLLARLLIKCGWVVFHIDDDDHCEPFSNHCWVNNFRKGEASENEASSRRKEV